MIYNSDVQFFLNTLFHVINFSGWSTLYRRANTTDNDCQYEESTRTLLLTQKIKNMYNCLITRLTGQLAGIYENWKSETEVIDTLLTKFVLINYW